MVRSSANAAITRALLAVTLAACAGPSATMPNVAARGNASLPSIAKTAHYAGAFYPIFGDKPAPGQWLVPNSSMPFDKVGDIFASFAHAYAQGKGAVLKFEAPYESARLQRLENVARAKNPRLKVLISLGWEKNDWTYIANDYTNKTALFVPSVVAFVRTNHLDGFDIDDESIGRSSGTISQPAFDAVIAQLRSALDLAAKTDKRTYFLVITPAGDNTGNNLKGVIGTTQLDKANARSFDWVNIQTYYGYPSFSLGLIADLKKINYPTKKIAVGVNTERCKPDFPSYNGLMGIFDWTMSADSICTPPKFKYTLEIAKDVGY
jgi:GH18 family chitinase